MQYRSSTPRFPTFDVPQMLPVHGSKVKYFGGEILGYCRVQYSAYWIRLSTPSMFQMFVLRILLVLGVLYYSYPQYLQYLGLQYCS